MEPNRVVREAPVLIALRHLVAEHRARRPVRVANRDAGDDALSLVEGRARELDQLVVQDLVDAVVLLDHPAHGRRVGVLGPGEDA